MGSLACIDIIDPAVLDPAARESHVLILGNRFRKKRSEAKEAAECKRTKNMSTPRFEQAPAPSVSVDGEYSLGNILSSSFGRSSTLDPSFAVQEGEAIQANASLLSLQSLGGPSSTISTSPLQPAYFAKSGRPRVPPIRGVYSQHSICSAPACEGIDIRFESAALPPQSNGSDVEGDDDVASYSSDESRCALDIDDSSIDELSQESGIQCSSERKQLFNKSSCTVLHKLVLKRDWHNVVQRARSYPKEIESFGSVRVRGSHQLEKLLPLHLACTLNPPLTVVNALIELSSTKKSGEYSFNSVEAGDKNGRLALHWACDAGGSSPDVIRTLLKSNPSAANIRELKCGFLPLHIACFYDSKDDFQYLEGDDNECRLSFKTRKEKQADVAEIVDMLLHASVEGASAKDDTGWLPLHIVCRTNAHGERLVSSLLRAYPQAAQIRDGSSRLPLHWACYHRCRTLVSTNLSATCEDADSANFCDCAIDDAVKLVRVLLDAYPEATCKIEKKYGFLPLHIACSSGASKNAIDALLEIHSEGAKKRDKNGSLPIHLACRSNATDEVINSLLSAFPEGAHFQDSDYRLPLHWACHVNSNAVKIATLLHAFDEGAQLTEAKYGYLPLHVACKRGASEDVIAALLTAFPEAAQTRDNNGNLPIHITCTTASYVSEGVIAMLLLAFPESLDREDKQGRTPIMIAQSDVFEEHYSINGTIRLLQTSPADWRSLAIGSQCEEMNSDIMCESSKFREGLLKLCGKNSSELLAALHKNMDNMKNNLLCRSTSDAFLSDCEEDFTPEFIYETSRGEFNVVPEPFSSGDAYVWCDDDEKLLSPQTDEDSVMCVLCLTKPVKYILYPCGHPCLCEACAQKHLESLNHVCPVGRCHFQDAVRVYGKIVGG